MLSEISQTEKDKYCMISLTYGIFKIQQTSEYNNKKRRYRKRTSDYLWGGVRGNIGVGVRGTNYRCETGYTDVLYSTGNINIL